LIQKHIKPKTTIVSDCWKAYDCLDAKGYVHFTVNHTYNFVDRNTSANTQTIESEWRQLKRSLSSGGVQSKYIDLPLCEYLWRREMKSLDKDKFLGFIECIKSTYE